MQDVSLCQKLGRKKSLPIQHGHGKSAAETNVNHANATGASVVGGGMHIAMHAFGKITLFFCAGAIYTAHHLTKVSELDGIGRKMPVTLSLIHI